LNSVLKSQTTKHIGDVNMHDIDSQNSIIGKSSKLPSVVSIVIVMILMLTVNFAAAQNDALSGQRFRVVVSTDIGGSDPDDFQRAEYWASK
jgi:hypothetical protein